MENEIEICKIFPWPSFFVQIISWKARFNTPWRFYHGNPWNTMDNLGRDTSITFLLRWGEKSVAEDMVILTCVHRF